ERGLAQSAVAGPLAELDLADQLGLDEGGVLEPRHRRVEGAVGTRERRHLLAQLVEQAVGEAGADVPRVDELPAVVVAEEEGTDGAGPPAFARRPAADHELLAPVVLDLEPGPRALAGLVDAVEALGHDALEARALAGLDDVGPTADRARWDLHAGPGDRQVLQNRSPLRIRDPHRRLAVELENVEHEIGHRRVDHAPSHLGLRSDVHAALQELEARPALIVEGHDLAVEHGRAPVELLPDTGDLRVLAGDVEQVAALDAD